MKKRIKCRGGNTHKTTVPDLRNNKAGITLIALIITIIILLILAGITINLTVGQKSILNRAQEAGRNYQEAAKREDEEMNNFLKEADDIINELIPKEPEISEKVKGLKAGDYIKYDTGVSSVGENGIIVCRVLYPVSSEYGLQIISDKNVENITLGKSGTWKDAREAYNGAIETLNDKTEKYLNSNYAYDSRCVGSIPTVENGMFIDKDKFKDSNGNVPGTVSILESWTGWENIDSGFYNSDVNAGKDVKALKEASILATGETYWLASRYYSYSVNMGFHVKRVAGSNAIGYALCYLGDNEAGTSKTFADGLRPCISLKSSIIKVTGGDGTEENPYTIGL